MTPDDYSILIIICFVLIIILTPFLYYFSFYIKSYIDYVRYFKPKKGREIYY
jgi:hypothetical protein